MRTIYTLHNVVTDWHTVLPRSRVLVLSPANLLTFNISTPHWPILVKTGVTCIIWQCAQVGWAVNITLNISNIKHIANASSGWETLYFPFLVESCGLYPRSIITIIRMRSIITGWETLYFTTLILCGICPEANASPGMGNPIFSHS